MKKSAWFPLALIIAGLVLTVNAFLRNASPYVTVAEARESQRPVHVALKPDPASTQFDLRTMMLTFEGKDETGTLKVVYPKGKPNNFEVASSVVVIGEYKDGVFHARDMLVKCPSKYQGEGQQAKR